MNIDKGRDHENEQNQMRTKKTREGKRRKLGVK